MLKARISLYCLIVLKSANPHHLQVFWVNLFLNLTRNIPLFRTLTSKIGFMIEKEPQRGNYMNNVFIQIFTIMPSVWYGFNNIRLKKQQKLI